MSDELIALADGVTRINGGGEIPNVTKVLYVEHDDDNLYMLKMRLEQCGDFDVLAAADSEQGCTLAVTEHPDVILMDLEMPVVDRWEPVRTLKNDPQTRNIPIIYPDYVDQDGAPPGRRRVNTEPVPGSLSTVMSPPII